MSEPAVGVGVIAASTRRGGSPSRCRCNSDNPLGLRLELLARPLRDIKNHKPSEEQSDQRDHLAGVEQRGRRAREDPGGATLEVGEPTVLDGDVLLFFCLFLF